MLYFLVVLGIALLFVGIAILDRCNKLIAGAQWKIALSKKRRLTEDAHNLYGWQPDIVRRLVNPRQDLKDNKKFFQVYHFTVNGFTQRLDLAAAQKLPEGARKAYGTLQYPDPNVFVIVEFVVASGENFRLLAEIDERYHQDDSMYRVSFGSFCFNTLDVGQDVYCKRGLRIPCLDFRIVLLPHEWENVKECLSLAKLQNGCASITIKIEYPGNPNPETVVEESISKGFRVCGFWADNLVAFDHKGLSNNLAFRKDMDLL